MKRKLFVGILAVVLAVSASVGIYAGVNGFGSEPAVEAMMGCCVGVEADVLWGPNPPDVDPNGGDGCSCRLPWGGGCRIDPFLAAICMTPAWGFRCNC